MRERTNGGGIAEEREEGKKRRRERRDITPSNDKQTNLKADGGICRANSVEELSHPIGHQPCRSRLVLQRDNTVPMLPYGRASAGAHPIGGDSGDCSWRVMVVPLRMYSGLKGPKN